MFDDSGNVNLKDFGLTENLNREKSVFGTLEYMSPHRIDRKDLEVRADIWALGTLLYEMVSGRICFEGINSGEIKSKILKCDYVSPQMYNNRISDDIELIIQKMVSNNPSDRFTKIRDLVYSIEH